jgi:PQQ enzyme repeat
MRNLLRIGIALSLGGVAACSNSGSNTISADGSTSAAGGAIGTAGTSGGAAGGARGGAGASGVGGRVGGAGGTITAGTGGAVGGAAGTSGGASAASVLQYHNNPARDGVYVDARLSRAAAATMHVDPTFGNTALVGPIYAQPLYLAGATAGADLVLVATAQNRVHALNAATGANAWNVQVGAPVPSTSAGLCGRPLNPLGITGTPVIDAATRTIYLDAMTLVANAPRHMVHALGIDTQGAERAGWPIDLNATARAGTIAFDSPIQNQRAALILLGGKVFVPFGGHIGDCLGYHGWLVGVTTSGTPQVSAWATSSIAGGIWGTSGIASDGTSLIVATGNTKAAASSGGAGTTPGDGNWGGGEAVIKFPTTLAQPTATQIRDYFVPGNWTTLDTTDADIGGTGPVLFRVAGATPSNLAMALGKDRKAYLLDPANLGGLDAAPLTSLTVASNTIITAASAYTTALGTYVVFRGAGAGCPAGQSGGLTAIRVSAASPPALSIAWCGGVTATSSPSVSMSSAQGADAIVWYVGSDARLHGLDGDTGASVVADTTALGTVVSHQTPIVANGRIFVATSNRVFAFTP